mgnify:CR=1 FL=1
MRVAFVTTCDLNAIHDDVDLPLQVVAFANAGISQRSRALKTDMQVYRDIIAVDLTAQIAFTQGLIGHMAERGSGALGFISSIAGKVGVPMRTAYCAAKFGLAGYADALRGELSQTGVTVHTIYPGSVATNVSRNALTADGARRGASDPAIDNGIPADVAARQMLDEIAAGTREIIVAEGELPRAFLLRVLGRRRRIKALGRDRLDFLEEGVRGHLLADLPQQFRGRHLQDAQGLAELGREHEALHLLLGLVDALVGHGRGTDVAKDGEFGKGYPYPNGLA